jgi:hypothetical protein
MIETSTRTQARILLLIAIKEMPGAYKVRDTAIGMPNQTQERAQVQTRAWVLTCGKPTKLIMNSGEMHMQDHGSRERRATGPRKIGGTAIGMPNQAQELAQVQARAWVLTCGKPTKMIMNSGDMMHMQDHGSQAQRTTGPRKIGDTAPRVPSRTQVQD